VITGGSPLLQQKRLVRFLEGLVDVFSFLPYIEIENECFFTVSELLMPYVAQWNNSPKLKNSGVSHTFRYKPEIIQATAALPNSWFKFVVSGISDWGEIEDEYLRKGLIRRSQIIVMPKGCTKEELEDVQESVVALAVSEGVRYSPRAHIEIWGKTMGV